ncbi:MAG TPA: DNA primase [Firmicutes bacterium]|nr:DNA primase [Bacillota bacterium]
MSARFSSAELEEIRIRNDIIEVISEYVPLRESGRGYKALCPFHSERTPSFTVSPEKQLFHCFGCGAGGDVFTFIMKIENLDFPGAVRFLADRAGIKPRDMPVGKGYIQVDREQLYKANELAADFFKKALLSKGSGERALLYIKSRGITMETIEKFRLGYAYPEWDRLTSRFSHLGISLPAAEKAGLVVKRKDGSGYYDRFRDRVMFAICDRRGRVIGFGGRVLDDTQPKYLNSAESPVFNKRHNLYGLYHAHESISKHGRAILVEGYTDVLALHQAGFDCAVASLGTALTPEQAKLLGMLAREVVLAYDPDVAGKMATLRGLELLLQAGLTVKVAELPEGLDPDEVIRNKGREFFAGIIDNAVGYIDYRLRVSLEKRSLDSTEDRVAIAREMVPVLASLPGVVARREYVAMVASRLGLAEDSLWNDVLGYQHRMPGSAVRQQEGAGPRRYMAPLKDKNGENGNTISRRDNLGKAYREAEATLLHLAIEDPEILARIEEEIGVEGFHYPEHQKIYSAILEASGHAARALAILGEGRERNLAQDIFSRELPCEEPGLRERVMKDCIRLVRERQLRLKIASLEEKMRLAEKKGETEKSNELLLELQQLAERLSRELPHT